MYQHIADLAGNARFVLPVPAFNIINGGSHAGNKLAMQVHFRDYLESLDVFFIRTLYTILCVFDILSIFLEQLCFLVT